MESSDGVDGNETDSLRSDLVVQLRKSIAKSSEMMLDEKVDLKVRERWTQVPTNTAQVLNQVLRDMQFKDWERRLKEMETRKRKLQGSISKLEKDAAGQTGEAYQG
ncbi:MAG TPA: hypothetical protein VGS11_13555 [Candidatus Bathyarchaeia archaeon]|nr:hypothetical protein [Candidatus Bathyarchaeia archaeon]